MNAPVHVRESLTELLLAWRRRQVRIALEGTDSIEGSVGETRLRDLYDRLVATEHRIRS